MRYNLGMSQNDKVILLHCCCAPCTILPLESLQRDGWQVALYYYNPNIHPQEEYEHRLAVLKDFAEAQAVSLQVGAYDKERWEEEVGVLGGPYPLIAKAGNFSQMEDAKRKRCRACYDLRFKTLASVGAAQGFQNLCTTLTISPYQFTREVQDSLTASAAEQSREALAMDWSSLYPQSVQRSRELGMYRQNYCGCRYSVEEAMLERAARKAERAADKRHAID